LLVKTIRFFLHQDQQELNLFFVFIQSEECWNNSLV